MGNERQVRPAHPAPLRRPGPFLPGSSETSPQTESLIDQEVQQLVERLRAETIELLITHRAQLEGLAEALLLAETLDAPAAYAAAHISARAGEPEPEKTTAHRTVA